MFLRSLSRSVINSNVARHQWAVTSNRQYHYRSNHSLATSAVFREQRASQVQCRHTFATTTTTTKLEKVDAKIIHKHEWDRAVSEAEKIVGYPTSFLSLRWLLSDEVANVAMHLRKLVGSSHPLLKTAKEAATQIVSITENERNLLYHGKNNVQAWGLIVLLISKAAGYAPTIPEMEQDQSVGVLHSQRALAEVTEMIRISHLVHQGLVNLQPLTQAGQDMSLHGDMTFGNKIALLSGDYLLGNSCVELAGLRNQELVGLISSAVRDMAESEFIGDRDEQNNPLPSQPSKTPRRQLTTEAIDDEFERHISDDVLKPVNKDRLMGSPDSEWMLRHYLSAASLLGKGCMGALILAQLPEAMRMDGFRFGLHVSLAWQASLDLEPFQSSSLPPGASFSLISAPVLFHLEHDPSAYEEIKKGNVSVENIDYVKLHSDILNGPAVDKTLSLQRKHSMAAMKVLNKFQPSDARTALQNILLAMQDL